MRSNSEELRACRPMRFEVGNFMEDNPCAVCGNQRDLHTSWTLVNLGRRFVACPNDKCKDFAWFDPPMCEKSVQIIPGLLRVRNNMERRSWRGRKRRGCSGLLWEPVGFYLHYCFSSLKRCGVMYGLLLWYG
ncbi:hypothetical protein Vadar_012025 [Vaccinium darrowii]|uniref:Uncharacterized protein n=1 Tax=Vaccinium darrowii TaxID=229202 RepID=A0ACB7ZL52_9ERIC|nr:hypothetical protein Vadar_012025 [Vaccinium darrowii]